MIVLRGLESSRVRPDHVLCCIAHAVSERSASSSGKHRRAIDGALKTQEERASRESSRDEKGEGVPGRGSSVSFTRCEVSRSWLDGVTRSLHRQRVRFRRATGVSDVARVISDSAGRKRPFRARAETTEARNGVVKRRPHRFTPRPSRVEGVNAETAQIRVPD
jgi:hypothetical protein